LKLLWSEADQALAKQTKRKTLLKLLMTRQWNLTRVKYYVYSARRK
jgi:hypothetical protein